MLLQRKKHTGKWQLEDKRVRAESGIITTSVLHLIIGICRISFYVILPLEILPGGNIETRIFYPTESPLSECMLMA